MTKTPVHNVRSTQSTDATVPESTRRAYEPPRIEVLCSTDEVVLSPSVGTFESGFGNGFRST